MPYVPEFALACMDFVAQSTKDERSSNSPIRPASSAATFRNGMDCLSHPGFLLSLGMCHPKC